MHIAYLTPEYPHPAVVHSAGIGTSIKNLASGLVSMGHRVTIFIYDQKENVAFTENGIHYHLIKRKTYKIGGFYFYRKFLATYINNHSKEIDLIEAPDWTGITAFMKLNKPLVIKIHGSDTYFCHLEKRRQKFKNYWLEKTAIKNADAICSVSRFAANTSQKLFKLYHHPITVIPNLIDLDAFTPLKKTTETMYILNFGSIIRKKGVLALAKAFEIINKRYPEAELLFLGKDVNDALTGLPTSQLIQRELSKATVNKVTFINQVAYSEVQDFISNAAVICLPSYAEAFPMTWLEAMAMQKPLVTSNIGWATEMMVHGQTGLMADPNNIEELSKHILSLLKNQSFAKDMGDNARQFVKEHFSKEQILELSISFYKKVVHA